MQQATTIKRFRSHPLYIVSILWKYLFILLVPVIRGLYCVSAGIFVVGCFAVAKLYH